MIKVYRNFLSTGECSRIKSIVYENMDKWNHYADIKVYGNSFFRKLLQTRFNVSEAIELYGVAENIQSVEYREFLLNKFSGIFKEVSFIDGFEIPGFQIVEQSTPRLWHYDDEKIRYPYKSVFPDSDFDRWITFTIMLSAGEFTYDYYSETVSEYRDPPTYYCRKHHGLIGDNCDCDLQNYQTIKYGIGDMILADGRYLHRVGESAYSTEKRITIQGHIVTKGSVAYLYW